MKNIPTFASELSLPLGAFCKRYGYTLNPKVYRNKTGRINRRKKDQSGNYKTVEMIYVQTTNEININELSEQEYEGQENPF